MAYNDPQLTHLDAMLSNISVGYQNLEFVSEVLFPPVRVAKQSDKYFVYEKSNFYVHQDIRAPGARANQLPPFSLSRESYFAQDHALEDVVPREEMTNADAPLQPLQEATERVTESVLLGREDAAATLARTAANYDTGHSVTLSGTDQWSDYTNSDPIDDIKAGRDVIHAAIFRAPNVMVMGYQVASKLEDHPDLIDRIKYSQRGVTTEEIMASIFGIPRIVRGSAVKATSVPGATLTTGYVWGKDVVLAYVPPSPGRRVPAYGYEFVWPFAEAGANGLIPTQRWWDQDIEAWKVRVHRQYDFKHIAIDNTTDKDSIAGYLIKNAVA